MTRPDPIIRPFTPLTPSATGSHDPSRWIEAVALASLILALLVFGTVQQERLERRSSIERNV
jgi:hypothetical protein